MAAAITPAVIGWHYATLTFSWRLLHFSEPHIRDLIDIDATLSILDCFWLLRLYFIYSCISLLLSFTLIHSYIYSRPAIAILHSCAGCFDFRRFSIFVISLPLTASSLTAFASSAGRYFHSFHCRLARFEGRWGPPGFVARHAFDWLPYYFHYTTYWLISSFLRYYWLFHFHYWLATDSTLRLIASDSQIRRRVSRFH